MKNKRTKVMLTSLLTFALTFSACGGWNTPAEDKTEKVSQNPFEQKQEKQNNPLMASLLDYDSATGSFGMNDDINFAKDWSSYAVTLSDENGTPTTLFTISKADIADLDKGMVVDKEVNGMQVKLQLKHLTEIFEKHIDLIEPFFSEDGYSRGVDFKNINKYLTLTIEWSTASFTFIDNDVLSHNNGTCILAEQRDSCNQYENALGRKGTRSAGQRDAEKTADTAFILLTGDIHDKEESTKGGVDDPTSLLVWEHLADSLAIRNTPFFRAAFATGDFVDYQTDLSADPSTNRSLAHAVKYTKLVKSMLDENKTLQSAFGNHEYYGPNGYNPINVANINAGIKDWFTTPTDGYDYTSTHFKTVTEIIGGQTFAFAFFDTNFADDLVLAKKCSDPNTAPNRTMHKINWICHSIMKTYGIDTVDSSLEGNRGLPVKHVAENMQALIDQMADYKVQPHENYPTFEQISSASSPLNSDDIDSIKKELKDLLEYYKKDGTNPAHVIIMQHQPVYGIMKDHKLVPHETNPVLANILLEKVYSVLNEVEKDNRPIAVISGHYHSFFALNKSYKTRYTAPYNQECEDEIFMQNFSYSPLSDECQEYVYEKEATKDKEENSKSDVQFIGIGSGYGKAVDYDKLKSKITHLPAGISDAYVSSSIAKTGNTADDNLQGHALMIQTESDSATITYIGLEKSDWIVANMKNIEDDTDKSQMFEIYNGPAL